MITELKAKALMAHQAIEQLQADSKTLTKQWNTALRNGEDDKSVTAIELAQTLNEREIVRAVARAEAADIAVRKAEAQAEAIAGKKLADDFIEADSEIRKSIADIDAAALLYIQAVDKLGSVDEMHIRETKRYLAKQAGALPLVEQLPLPNDKIVGACRRALGVVSFLNNRQIMN